MLRRPLVRGRSDRGAALVIALVFVSVISLVVAAALSYTTTSLRNSSRRYEPARERLYAADAAMKAAALYIAATPSAGVAPSGSTCAPTLTYGTLAGQAITVQPCPKANSFVTVNPSSFGMQLLASGVNTNALTLGQGASLQVNGDLKVNGKVTVGNNSLVVRSGALTAANCTISQSGSITSNGTAVGQNDAPCKTGSTAVDPAYTPGITSYPAASAAPGACSSDVLTVQPGRWTATTIAALDDCSWVYLAPGVHVIENLNWTLDRPVVAGALRTGVTVATLTSTPYGQACDSTLSGTMLVIAGSSSITFQGSGSSPAQMEICGIPVAQTGGSSPRIAFYGSSSAISFPTTRTMTATGASGAAWTSASNASALDGSSVATSPSVAGGGATSAALTISGFTATIPSTVTTLTASLGARKTNNAPNMNISLAVRNSGSSSNACTGSASLTTSLTARSVTLNCTVALSPPLSVVVTVSTSGGSSSSSNTATVDGLTLSFSDAVSIAASGDGVTAIDAGTNGGDLYIRGETYLPRSHVILTQSKVRSALTSDGVVLKSLEMKTNASSTIVPVIAFVNGSYSDGDIELKTSVGGTPWLGCRVKFPSEGYYATRQLQGCSIPR